MKTLEAALAWCPFPDAATARAIANQLLAEKLIACANLFPVIESVFEWEGEASSATEAAALFKTTAEQLDALVARLGELHPYDIPAIVAWRCDAAHPATLEWLNTTLGTPRIA